MEKLRAKRLAIIAMNNPRLPRSITRTQTFDALFFMANIAGYRGVVEAANAFGRYFSGQQIAGGTGNEPSYDLSSLTNIKNAQAEAPQGRQRSNGVSARLCLCEWGGIYVHVYMHIRIHTYLYICSVHKKKVTIASGKWSRCVCVCVWVCVCVCMCEREREREREIVRLRAGHTRPCICAVPPKRWRLQDI